MDTDSYDYIIVGAGAAGCVLANRLSADPALTVCLLEARPVERHPLLRLPAGLLSLIFGRAPARRRRTEAQAQLHSRRLDWARGASPDGGAGNALLYTRGHASDYEHWAALGNPGWAYAEVLPLFKRAEHQQRGASDYHGAGGPLNVADARAPHLLSAVYLHAALQAGHVRNHDFNAASQDGVGLYQRTYKNGKPCSVARAYLHPVLERRNLTVLTGARVGKVLFDARRASGVAYMKDGRRATLRARGEVILAGGAIHSPQLLMLSGIGPARELRRHGIAPLHELPGVGQNLQDHLEVALLHKCLQPAHAHTDASCLRRFMEIASDISFGAALKACAGALLRRGGKLLKRLDWRRASSDGAAEGGAFIKSAPALAAPDLQFHFTPAALDGHGYGLRVAALRPKSRGHIGLASADPAAAPVIEPNYLSHPDDLDSLLSGVKAARRVLAGPAFERFRGREIMPGAAVEDDAQLRDFIRRKAVSARHPVGTCKMGCDTLAVVDARLQVRGVDGLRVADASIMPTIIGGNTHAASVMIAEKAAEMILQTRAQQSQRGQSVL